MRCVRVACLLLALAAPVLAGSWGTLFFSDAERHPVAAASPVYAIQHVFSGQTVVDGRVRNWVDAASTAARIPAGKRVGDTWRDQ
ncbi:hypothetical protein [Silvimonas amylolytica]|uniref:hypothetical protein n=1 Tax=Silvimonas amylolytica TaxID=449663 RepID=UPI00166A2D6F|nr:hypothetical protein [Silvimonas amylolytica]